MDRTEQIREYLKPYIVKRVQRKIEETIQMKVSHLQSSVADLLGGALKRQEEQPQWKPSYMGMLHLSTSLLTESYEYELFIADKQMYLDESQVIRYWKPEFLYQDAQEEDGVRKELTKRFVRLTSYEVSYAKRFLFYEYRNIAGVYWKENLDKIIKLEGFINLKKTDQFLILFGDYMGKIHTVLSYGEGM